MFQRLLKLGVPLVNPHQLRQHGAKDPGMKGRRPLASMANNPPQSMAGCAPRSRRTGKRSEATFSNMAGRRWPWSPVAVCSG